MAQGRVRGPPYTENDRRKILRLRREGKTNREIGELMGRTVGSIGQHINQHRNLYGFKVCG